MTHFFKKKKLSGAFSGSEGVGRGDGHLSHEYWVLFQIIHRVVIRYSTKGNAFLELTTRKRKKKKEKKKIKVSEKTGLIYPTVAVTIMSGQLLASLASKVCQVFLTA